MALPEDLEKKLSYDEKKIYDNYRELFAKLDELWAQYEKESYEIIKRWDIDKILLLEKMSKLSGLLKRLDEEINELRVKVDVGLISHEDAETNIEKLESLKNETIEKLTALEQAYSILSQKAEKHKKKILPLKIKASREEIEDKLIKLDERFKKGEIEEAVYQRLRRELLELLKYVPS